MRRRLSKELGNDRKDDDDDATLPFRRTSPTSRMRRTTRSPRWRTTVRRSMSHLYCSLIVVSCLAAFLLWKNWKVLFPKITHGPTPPPNAAFLVFGNRSAVKDLYARTLNHKNYNSISNSNVTRNSKPPLLPVIFYNIYIPPADRKAANNAVKIVKEQLGAMATIILRNGNRRDNGQQQVLQVYYTTIGNDKVLTVNEMNRMCTQLHPNMRCELLQHHESATEVVTLQALHEYCVVVTADDLSNTTGSDNIQKQQQQRQQQRVVYLHSKGTFHDNAVNTAWRRALTAAALDESCWNPPTRECNVCGLQFYTQFTLFVPGNMWAADCAYVRHLLAPNDDAGRREAAVAQFLLYRLSGHMQSLSVRDRRDYFGLDRYAVEHWIGGHPNLLPCDVMMMEATTTGNLPALFQRNAGGDAVADRFDWSMAPRHAGFAVGVNWAAHARLHNSTPDRLREYYLLPGHIVKWFSMYGRAPDADSWVWKWFPDGDLWLEAVQQYGMGAIEHVTQQDAIQHQQDAGAFALEIDRNTSVEWFSPPPTGFVIFYHIELLANDVETSLQLVQEQLEIIGASHVDSASEPVTVFFNVVGNSVGQHSVDLILGIGAAEENVQCRPMLHFDRAYEGETMQQLFRFCASQGENPSSRVAYIHNQEPTQLREQSSEDLSRLIRHMTMAVTSKWCVSPPKGTCNVCGLIFYTMWTLFLPGNMFTASCAYVKQLIPPVEFEGRLKDAIAQLLLARLRLQVTSSIFPDRVAYLGMEHYAMDHWIGSHPTLHPCDLTSKFRDFGYWRVQDRDASDFDWSMAPRHSNSPFGDFNSTQKQRVLESESLRRREHQFLAGHLLTWYSLYGEAPPPDSWIWYWFPDGLKWKEGVARHGAKVVEALTADFSYDGLNKAI